MKLYVCPICQSEHEVWDDSWLCFTRCAEQADADIQLSRNVKPPELLCECTADDLQRRGLVFHFSLRSGLRPRADGGGYWMTKHWPTKTGEPKLFLVTYCPWCGRKPRMTHRSGREYAPKVCTNPGCTGHVEKCAACAAGTDHNLSDCGGRRP